jgi:hypothetical protein
MPNYHCTPQDVLFFRDARPMVAGEGSGGHGARWPEPSVLFDALHAALHRAFPGTQEDWEHEHRFATRAQRNAGQEPGADLRNQRFGSLCTTGPFPVRTRADGVEWLFPVPSDALPGARGPACLAPLRDPGGQNNLPRPLRHTLASPAAASKDAVPQWWTRSSIEEWLVEGRVDPAPLLGDAQLYDSEWVTGIGIDAARQAQDGERIYSAEYLRLKPGFALGFSASMPLKGNGEEGMSRLFPGQDHIICGGQQRICTVEKAPEQALGELLPVAPKVEGCRVKWLLLSPALFPEDPLSGSPGGWLPNWIDPETGAVGLLDGPGGNKARRKGLEPGKPIRARLVAARIPSPLVLTGWTERLHVRRHEANQAAVGQDTRQGARPTRLAVPAGTVYYFEAESPAEAGKLADALNWHGTEGRAAPRVINRRSTLLGEKGFGIGVCGPWDYFEDVRKRPATGNPSRERGE